jgi:hypothetical protein
MTTWRRSPVRIAITAASFLLFAFAPAMAAEFASLPPGQGRDVMVRVCSQCHSPDVAAGRRMDQPGWKGLVDQMANNGAQASDAEFDVITKYLAASFPAGAASASSADSPRTAAIPVAKTGAAQGADQPALAKAVGKPGRGPIKTASKPSAGSRAKMKTKGAGPS